MADDLLRKSAGLKLNVKTKIRYNGQEYSDPRDLPPNIRAAYEQAMRSDPGSPSSPVVKKKFVINGQEFDGEETMPADVRRLCDDVMSVIENNGEVTLPESPRTEPLITKSQLRGLFVLIGTLVGAGVVVFLRRLL